MTGRKRGRRQGWKERNRDWRKRKRDMSGRKKREEWERK